MELAILIYFSTFITETDLTHHCLTLLLGYMLHDHLSNNGKSKSSPLLPREEFLIYL